MQAAGGTPVGEDNGGLPHEPAASTGTGRRTWWWVAIVFAVFYGIDQWTKVLAVEHLTGAADKQLVGEILQLRLTYNPGAAFGLGDGATVAITCLAIVATVVVVFFGLRVRDRIWAVSLGLLLAGIDGNLTDRLFREPQAFHGHVVDFLMLPHWPIFNVADICINLGAALALIQVFRGVRLDGSRESDHRPTDETTDQTTDPTGEDAA